MSNSGEVEAQAPVAEQPQVPEKEAPATEAPAEQPVEGPKEEEKKPVKERKKRERAPKENKDNKPKTPAHPPYFQMIKEAITAVNEKGGSSPYAIAKYMEEKHKSVLPANFRKILGLQLKNSVSKGKLIKIKASYKLSEAGKKKDTSMTTRTTRTKAARANAGAKPKEGTKRRKPKSRVVSKIENPPANAPAAVAVTRARRSKRSAPAKPKQLKSIRGPIAKKARKSVA